MGNRERIGMASRNIKNSGTDGIREDAKKMELNDEEKNALKAIDGGADVYSYGIAQTLRRLEKEHSDLFVITKAMNAPKNGALRQPYFGAILTAKGKEVLKILSNIEGD